MVADLTTSVHGSRTWRRAQPGVSLTRTRTLTLTRTQVKRRLQVMATRSEE